MALLPTQFLDMTVALGHQLADGQITYSATGFFCGHPTGTSDKNGNSLYWPFLVTNRHVIERINSSQLSIRLNRFEGTDARLYSLQIRNDDGSYVSDIYLDPDLDIAAILVDFSVPIRDGIGNPIFITSDMAIDSKEAREKGISEGDGVFVLGFPLGQAGKQRNYAIVRQGIIARVRDYLEGTSQEFLIDASIFPGNSGGPVFTKPEAVSLQGTKANVQCRFIGMVCSYLPYEDTAVSVQTGRSRILFQENSGLGVVVPYDAIRLTIEKAITTGLQSSLRFGEEETEGISFSA